MRLIKISVALAIAALTACGGGGDAPAPASAPMIPLVADAAPPQAATTWTPSSAGLMEWAEATYPQLFPTGAPIRSYAGYLYRLYPQTGNYLAVSGDGVYIHGPVAGGVLTRVGSLSDFTCQINPYVCAASTSPVIVPAAATTAVVPASTLPGVTAVLNFPRSITADVVQGQRLNTVSISGTAAGNISSLSGRTLYIVIEDPHSLFEPSPAVSLSASGVLILAFGKVLPTAGLLAGNLRIYACLDPQCSTALAGSPLVIPYSVTVSPGIATDVQSIGVFPGFGEIPAARNIRVTLPPNTTAWNASLLSGNGGGNYLSVTTDNQWGNIVGNVAVRFAAAPVGNYRDTVRISGSQTLSSGGSQSFTKDIPVTYTVNPNAAVDVVISPVETVVPMKFGDSTSSPNYPRTALANTGVTLRQQATEYLSAPAAAAGHPKVSSWWSDTNLSASTCSGLSCLPAGTYQARVRYTKTKAGISSDVFHVITMQIYP